MEEGEPPLAVTINVAGGVVGGDHHRVEVVLGPGSQLTVASQAAERIYRALPGQTAHIDQRLVVGPRAALDWLPQETILFEGAALDRTLSIELDEGAGFTGVEWLVFGRAAMGERVESLRLADRLLVSRQGRLVLRDATRVGAGVGGLLARPACGGGALGMASLLHAGPEAPALLGPLRAALAPFEAGASAWEGLLLARILAEDGAALRRAVTAGLNVLRAGRRLPRTWLC